MKRAQGFTLIELIIVIVILGILAVTAAPKFIDFTTDANKSALQGLKGGISGAMQITLSRSSIDGEQKDLSAELPNLVDTKFGFPTAKDADAEDGIVRAAGLDAADDDLESEWAFGTTDGSDPAADSLIIAASSNVTVTGTPDKTKVKAAIIASDCYITYTSASRTGAGTPASPYVYTDASVAITKDTGC